MFFTCAFIESLIALMLFLFVIFSDSCSGLDNMADNWWDQRVFPVPAES